MALIIFCFKRGSSWYCSLSRSYFVFWKSRRCSYSAKEWGVPPSVAVRVFRSKWLILSSTKQAIFFENYSHSVDKFMEVRNMLQRVLTLVSSFSKSHIRLSVYLKLFRALRTSFTNKIKTCNDGTGIRSSISNWRLSSRLGRLGTDR